MDPKENLQNADTWLRGLFIVIMGVIFYVAFGWLIWLLVLFQFLFKLITGEVNAQALKFSPQVTNYANQILQYVTYQSDEKPWPLTLIPKSPAAGSARGVSVEQSEPEKGTAEETAPKTAG